MIADYTPVPALAVSDLERARAFYEGVLGLSPSDEEPDGGIQYTCGDGSLMVYPSQYAGTNKATAVGFRVPTEAFDEEVTRLRDAGVVFQTFEIEGMEWQDGVAVAEGGRAVWFADPDGNILAMDSLS